MAGSNTPQRLQASQRILNFGDSLNCVSGRIIRPLHQIVKIWSSHLDIRSADHQIFVSARIIGYNPGRFTSIRVNSWLKVFLSTHIPTECPMTSRREFLYSVSAMAAAPFIESVAKSSMKSYGIAYTSFPIRMRQAREAAGGPGNQGPAITAEKFIDLCQSFGGDGCQMDFSQLASTDAEYLKRVRAQFEAKGMFMELAVRARALDSEEEVAKIAAAAHQLGVSRLRVACLSGRRYEDFHDMAKWKEFAAQWQKTLEKAEPMLKKHKLLVGVEMHKDWLADEQVAMLKRIGSEYLGACVDFGNNLALLEDSVEVAEKLAPYAMTTHLKDMAVRLDDEGSQLAEVGLW